MELMSAISASRRLRPLGLQTPDMAALGSEHEIATAIARCAEERAWRRCDYFETADIVAGSALLMC
jgi:hypothetical protein